jgi:CTP synthase (UTP-ammonia lyase)
MDELVRIGIIGDFDPNLRTHKATDGAFWHAGHQLSIPLEVHWLPTPSLLEPAATGRLAECAGLFAAAGTPYRNMQGALRAIEFARTRDWPFLGTCGGFQHALIEFARNVLGISDADSAEHGSESSHLLIAPVSCSAPNRLPGGPKLSGSDKILLQPDSQIARIYERLEVSEEYHCNYELDAAYRERFESAGLRITGVAEGGQIRAIELPGNTFFVCTLFQPQLRPLGDTPHPLIAAFVTQSASRAAIRAAR